MKRRNLGKSANGKRNGQPTKQKPLSEQSDKLKSYTRDFLAYPKEFEFSERIAKFSREKGISKSVVYRYARNLNWRDLLDEQLKDFEHKSTVDSLKDEIVTFDTKMTFADISDVLKKNTTFSLIVTNGLLKHTLVMMDYYAKQIETIIVAAGGVHSIAPEDKMQIEFYEKKMQGYKDEIKFLIQPTQISSYMKMLGIHDEIAGIGSVEGTGEKLTPEFILRTMSEMGAKSSFEKEAEADRMISEVHRQTAQDTEVDGRILKDENVIRKKPKNSE